MACAKAEGTITLVSEWLPAAAAHSEHVEDVVAKHLLEVHVVLRAVMQVWRPVAEAQGLHLLTAALGALLLKFATLDVGPQNLQDSSLHCLEAPRECTGVTWLGVMALLVVLTDLDFEMQLVTRPA